MTQASPNIEDAARIETSLFCRARQTPDREALVDGDRRLTFAELAAAVSSFGGRLIDANVCPGDRVALYLDKSIEAVVAFFGIWSAGAVAVPMHHSLKSTQVKQILSDSGAILIVSEGARIVGLEPGALGEVALLDVKAGASTSAPSPLPRGLPWERAPALILYTSGSTGQPKGILISHGNLSAGARIVSGSIGIARTDRILSVLPFSFDYGLNQLLTTVRRGAALVLQRSHHPSDICRSLVDEHIKGMAGVPLLWAQLMQRHSPFSTLSFPSLRFLTNSGGAFPLSLLEQYRAQLPKVRVFLMYGLSEAFRSTILQPEEIDRHPDSMGKAIPETNLFVVNEAGEPCAPGETGQLVHVGPTVAMGYWNDPERSRSVFRRHPFDSQTTQRAIYSGDLVRRDAEGRFYFVGRSDQMMKCNGFRVSPDEVEKIVQGSGLVAEVVAHGEPDELHGMSVVVIDVVPKQTKSFVTAPLLAFCRREMPGYMVPQKIRIHDALPRTTSGKIDRAKVATG